MKTLENVLVPAENKYTPEHIWIRKDGDTYLVGISDFAQDQLGEIVFVELPSEGTHIEANECFGDIESMKSVNKLFMPISGKIIDINTKLEDIPTLINIHCYTDAWMLRIEADSTTDVDILLSSEEYKQILS